MEKEASKHFAVLIPCTGQLWVCCLLFHRCIPQCYSSQGPGPLHLPPSVLIHCWEWGSWKRGEGNLQNCIVQPRGQPRQLCTGMLHLELQQDGWLSAGRSLTSTGTGLATRESGKSKGIRRFWVRFLCISSPPPQLLYMHTLLQSLIFPRFLFRSAMQLHCTDFATRMHPYLW